MTSQLAPDIPPTINIRRATALQIYDQPTGAGYSTDHQYSSGYRSADYDQPNWPRPRANDVGKRIFSALVTEHGNDKETPINIMTPWDFVAGKLH